MSASFKGGDKLRRYLGDMAQKNNRAYRIQVGVFDGATYDDGTPVAQVAAVQEYGSPTQNIPARPFLRRTVAEKGNDWPHTLAALLRRGLSPQEALDQLGIRMSAEVRNTISEIDTPALAPSTKATRRRKGHTNPDKPLIDTRVLWYNITHRVEHRDGS